MASDAMRNRLRRWLNRSLNELPSSGLLRKSSIQVPAISWKIVFSDLMMSHNRQWDYILRRVAVLADMIANRAFIRVLSMHGGDGDLLARTEHLNDGTRIPLVRYPFVSRLKRTSPPTVKKGILINCSSGTWAQ
jgi:hypothetical protein